MSMVDSCQLPAIDGATAAEHEITFRTKLGNVVCNKKCKQLLQCLKLNILTNNKILVCRHIRTFIFILVLSFHFI